MAMGRVTMVGQGQMAAKLRQISRNFPDRVARAEYDELQFLVPKMQARTPVDMRSNAPHPGRLRNGIHVEEPEIRRNVITTIVATSANAPYAVYVHENPDAHHTVGQWKFMQSVLDEEAHLINARIAVRIHFDRGEAA
jgi:hypothetical protein